MTVQTEERTGPQTRGPPAGGRHASREDPPTGQAHGLSLVQLDLRDQPPPCASPTSLTLRRSREGTLTG